MPLFDAARQQGGRSRERGRPLRIGNEMAREDPEKLREVNAKLRQAIRDCEEQLEMAREALRRTKQDNDPIGCQ